MRKTILAITMAIVLSLGAFGGCAEEPSAQEIIDGMLQAQGDITSYQFDMEADMVMDMAIEMAGEPLQVTAGLDASGAFDLGDMKLDMSMVLDIKEPGESDEVDYELSYKMAMEMYIVDNMLYIKMPAIPFVPNTPEWMKLEIPEGDWDEMGGMIDMAGIWASILETMPVEVTGSEKVSGVDCYVLEYTINVSQLWDTLLEQLSVVDGDMFGEGDMEFPDGVIVDFYVWQWVDKDNYYTTRYEMDMTVEITPEVLGGPISITMDIAEVYMAYDYNQPVDIVLPVEAEEAVSLW